MIDKNGYEDEMERHNKALEQMAAAKEAFYENEVKQHDRIQLLRQQLMDANKDIKQTNNALDLYQKVKQLQTVEYGGRKFSSEPNINQFYTPSSEMKKYQHITAGGLGIGAAYIASKVI